MPRGKNWGRGSSIKPFEPDLLDAKMSELTGARSYDCKSPHRPSFIAYLVSAIRLSFRIRGRLELATEEAVG